jgi:hypothetical protein
MFFMPAILSACAVVLVCPGSPLEQTGSQASARIDAALGSPSDPFIGKWKLDPSRSKAGDEMKVAEAGQNRYTFDFGADKRESIVADGTDQPGEFGTTLAVTVEGPNSWKVIRKIGGHIAISAMWELSPDGNTLTDHYTSIRPDGSSKLTDYLYKRTAGNAGFAGTWESTTPPSAFEMQIEGYEGDGLSFINPGQQSTKSLKFDGKDYPGTGSSLPAGFVSSGHRVSPHSFQVTEKIEGKAIDTQQAELSADLKTLTITLQPASQSKPKIMVFDRE